MEQRTIKAVTGEDRLTGLADERAAKAWMAARGDTQISVTLFSIADFGMVNSAFGRNGGNAVLVAVAERLAAISKVGKGGVSSTRMAARLTGTDFVLLDADRPVDDALIDRARMIVGDLAHPVTVSDGQIDCSIHAGIVKTAGDLRELPAATIDRARMAATYARSTGRNAYFMGTAQSDPASQLAIDLRRALGRDEIDVVFQPQVDARTKAILGVEALARWSHDKLGPISTAQLFDAARRSDFGPVLTWHILAKALDEVGRWPEALSAVRLSLNVTARDLARSNFEERLFGLLKDLRVDHSRITIEVTEDSLIADLAAAGTQLATLRKHGLKVSLDDFGTGYSSLAYLQALPVDAIKLDKSLTQGIAGGKTGDDRRARVIVESVIMMGQKLQLDVLAEGVENEAERTALIDLGCIYHQGFLYARPMDGEKFCVWTGNPI